VAFLLKPHPSILYFSVNGAALLFFQYFVDFSGREALHFVKALQAGGGDTRGAQRIHPNLV
jgi:hypothetical protein